MLYKVNSLKRFYKKADGTPFKNGACRIVMTLDGVEGSVSFFDNKGDYEDLEPEGSIVGAVHQDGKYMNFVPEGSSPSPKRPTLQKGPAPFEAVVIKKLDEILSHVRAADSPSPGGVPDDLPF